MIGKQAQNFHCMKDGRKIKKLYFDAGIGNNQFP